MKKIPFYFILCLILISFVSCNNPANSTSEEKVETVKVLIKASGTTTTYELIDQEGEMYKSGKVWADETITINHFKKGTYNLRYADISNPTNYLRATIEINKDCTITFTRTAYSIN